MTSKDPPTIRLGADEESAKQLSELLKNDLFPILIEIAGKPVGAILSMRHFDLLREIEDRALVELAEEGMKQGEEEGWVDLEDLLDEEE